MSGGNIALVGHPNVGKSVIFQRLTGQHAAVSNYPGTTVEIMRGAVRQMPGVAVVDTPGVITFPPHSDDELVTEKVILNENLRAILQVGDAKNLRRTLLLTVQLAEMRLPMALALNMMDEAQSLGMVIDHELLSSKLGVPVVPTTAIRGYGVDDLVAKLQTSRATQMSIPYPQAIEAALQDMVACLDHRMAVASQVDMRALILLWLSGDVTSRDWLQEHLAAETLRTLAEIRTKLQTSLDKPLPALIQQARLKFTDHLVKEVLTEKGGEDETFSAHLGRLSTHPLWGIFILAAVMYALYWFVGVFGAGFLVDLLENKLFSGVINPAVTAMIERLITVRFISDFLVGPYGLWTLGVTYALALILPIVTTFFIAFGILEDSGYLPRLAALSNRMFQALGLNGKAVLPMVLGLGCVTMATVTTRVLENRRERFLVTLLLALAVPCSAQLGVVMGMLAGISLTATLIWSSVVFLVLLAVGWLAARFVPGERSELLVELPPMRLPEFSNVVLKTLARLEWYVKEVIPLFLLGAAIMFVMDEIGALAWLSRAGEPLVSGWLGLPPQASAAFLMGFLRRDFGATGLFVMQSHGMLTPLQVVVAMVTITLFIPCIASVLMIVKERGWKTALGMTALILPLSFLVGGVLNRILIFVGWGM
ncbi:MAG: ferrous iron transport protein B [Anaerolineales bacterium]